MVQRPGLEDDQLTLDGHDLPLIYQLVRLAQDANVLEEVMFEYGEHREKGFTVQESVNILYSDYDL